MPKDVSRTEARRRCQNMRPSSSPSPRHVRRLGGSMERTIRLMLLPVVAAVALVLPLSATADVTEAVSTFTYTKNMHPLGYSARAVPLSGTGSGIVNSDLAFWGKMAVQGTYEGFRLI